MRPHNAFTLIELLVVIAIIAILAVVVVLTLNPAQLLAQSRDANRVSDLATLNSAIGLYQTDTGGAGPMGTSSIVYVSLVDTSSTCGNLGLPILSSATYYCATSTSSRNTDTSGWIPLNFSSISAGSPIGSLPIDPTNTSSSGLYYGYLSGSPLAGTWEIVARFESQKYTASGGPGSTDGGYNDRYAEAGKDLTLALNAGKLLDRVTSTDYLSFDIQGLVGYWPMDEGSGSTSGTSQTADASGNRTGIWYGNAVGTNGTYYSAGKIGSWAGAFDGSTNYVKTANISLTQTFTVAAWVNPNSITVPSYARIVETNYTSGFYLGTNSNNSLYQLIVNYGSIGTCFGGPVVNGTWQYVVGIYNGSTGSLYVNGNLVNSNCSFPAPGNTTLPTYIGTDYSAHTTNWKGLIDDVRIYNRALSAAEIQALYSAGK